MNAAEINALMAFEKWADALVEHADVLDLDPKSVAEHVRKLIREAAA